MKLTLRHLLERLTQPKSRVEDLRGVRSGLREALQRPSCPEEQLLAQRLRENRARVVELIGEVEACKTCSARRRVPGEREGHGPWGGGHCCGGECSALFTCEELATLAIAGTRESALRPPPSHTEHVGCAFRGHQGCSLAVYDRPNVCLQYICKDLRSELVTRGAWGRLSPVLAELERDFAAFSTLFAEREEAAELERWTRALS